jgi:tetratricopeptide (TPR) repeat protein
MMSNDGSSQDTELKHLSKHFVNFFKVLGGVAGASSLGMTIIYAMGFVVVNTSLLRHGAYELSILRTEFLAAGISYSVLTLGMILLGALAVDWVVEKEEPLLRWKPVKRFLETVKVPERTTLYVVTFLGGTVLLLAVKNVAGLFSAGMQWWDRFGRAVRWGYYVALVGGIYVEDLEGKELWQKLVSPAPELPEMGKAVLGGILLLLVALVSYGGYAYPHLPKSWGGGSPIYVEFVVEEEARAMLETLGLKVGDQGLTERVTFLTESPERIFVVTQREDTLSFDPGLVKASKFYDVNYYVSAEAHLTSGDWYREEKQWDRAISEYSAALLIQADLLDARIGRGRARAEKYLESYRKDSPDEPLYKRAHKDLLDAIRQAEQRKDDPTAALAHYELGRLCFCQEEHQNAATEVKDAIDLDESFRREALLYKAFWEDIRAADDTFRRALHHSDSWIATEYAELARELENAGEMEEAADLYDLAAHIAEHCAEDGECAAEYRFYKGNVLENVPRVEDAIQEYREAVRLMPAMAEYRYRLAVLSYERERSEDAEKEYREAVKRNPNMTHYRYRFALLSYGYGLWEQAEGECRELIELATEAAKEDVATISCRIVLGNVYRELGEWDVAKDEYEEAANKALEWRAPSLATEAYYDYARLEARRGDISKAIGLLEKAVWLDEAHLEKAEVEADFNILRAFSDYQKAISPPIVERIESDVEKRTVMFHLQEPADDFVERVMVLTGILGREHLTPVGIGEAEKVEVSEDQLVYTFRLREEASYNASELASAVRELLRLASEPLTQESSATD